MAVDLDRRNMMLSWYAARNPQSVIARMGSSLLSQPQQQVSPVEQPQIQQPQVTRPTPQPTGGGGQAAVQMAAKYTNVREFSPNRSPFIDKIQAKFGLRGQAWCGAFVGAMANAAGARIGRRVVYVPYIVQDAQNRRNGFSGWSTNTRAARPGDFVVMHGRGHVEMVERVLPNGDIVSVGGNTSRPGGGEGVARKIRRRGVITGIAHVRYA